MDAGLIALIVLAVFLFIVAASGVRIVPQARAGIVERLGRYAAHPRPRADADRPVRRPRQAAARPARAGRLVPAAAGDHRGQPRGRDRHRHLLHDHRPKAATYEVANPLQAIEQLTVTTLRNVIGGLTLEETLTSRDNVNSQLRVVLDEATGKWGIRVNRVELKSVEPPRTVQEAMEKQMRAERDRRATILTAEGVKQSQILTAEGEKQSAVLKAEGARTAAILRAEGEAKAIETVFGAIHDGVPDERLLSYQYLQMLPQLAQGPASKIFVIPSEFTQALGNLTQRFADAPPPPRPRVRIAAGRRGGERGRRGRRGGSGEGGRRRGRGGHERAVARRAAASRRTRSLGRALDAVGRVQRGHLVGLGERRVVEDRRHEEVDRGAGRPSRPARCGRGRSRPSRSRAPRAGVRSSEETSSLSIPSSSPLISPRASSRQCATPVTYGIAASVSSSSVRPTIAISGIA